MSLAVLSCCTLIQNDKTEMWILIHMLFFRCHGRQILNYYCKIDIYFKIKVYWNVNVAPCFIFYYPLCTLRSVQIRIHTKAYFIFNILRNQTRNIYEWFIFQHQVRLEITCFTKRFHAVIKTGKFLAPQANYLKSVITIVHKKHMSSS